MTFSSIYTQALALMPHLPCRANERAANPVFAVATDACGTYHLLAHYDLESLLYIKVIVEDGFVTIADLRFTRATDDLCFFGAQPLGTLHMQSSPERYDFDWYRNGVYGLFRMLVDLPPNTSFKAPGPFSYHACLHNNGAALLGLLHSLRCRREPASALPDSAPRYAF